ncbi:MAG: hypothetical protein ABSD20_01020 [Terriglobales bacterium]|jgi:hypothetical protein
MRITNLLAILVLNVLVAVSAGAQPAEDDAGGDTGAPAVNVTQAIDRMSQREAALVSAMQGLHPVVETYLQMVRSDEELGTVPASDHYFLGRLYFTDGFQERFYTTKLEKTGWKASMLSPLASANLAKHFFSVQFLPVGFSSMLFPDSRGFDRDRYTFHFLRREFLGDVRCLVFSVEPANQGHGRFEGQIWVEDKEYNLVRFNGIYTHPVRNTYFHMDSWRTNVKPGLWVPTATYVEENGLKPNALKRTVRFKGQTRLWDYDQKPAGRQEEFTDIEVDTNDRVEEETTSAPDFTPVMSLRAWEREAEDNVLDRLEQAGLLAPPGPMDKVLEQIVTNLEVGSGLEIEPDVRCRVLLTSPLESATIGHTIIISRGLIDVVPDESSLALLLSVELGSIARGEQIDTKYSFSDRLDFKDEAIYREFVFKRTTQQEEAADSRALALFNASIYRNKSDSAGLFLRQLQNRANGIPNLVQAHLGNSLVENGSLNRLAALIEAAPALQMSRVDQVAALPLGARIQVNPWDGSVELLQSRQVALLSAREKMPFEVAPVVINLSRNRSTFTSASTSASVVTLMP